MVKNQQGQTTHALSPIEEEIIHFFVRLATTISLPKSLGEIFGLLFASPDPVPFDDVVQRLGVSKGSASQGLRMLQKLGAVETVYVTRDRRTFYRAETSMRKLFTGFLDETIRPHLEAGESQLDNIATLLAGQDGEPDGAATLAKRVASLQTWHQKARRLLPWIARLTAPPKRSP